MLQYDEDIANLPWLLKIDDATNVKINDFSLNADDAWSQIRKIVVRRLSTRQTQSLYKKIKGLTKSEIKNLRLTEVKVCIVGAATFDHLISLFMIAGLRHNIYLNVIVSDFGQASQIAFNTPEYLKTFNPDIIFHYDDSIVAEEDIDLRLSQIFSFADRYSKNLDAVTVFNTLVPKTHDYVFEIDPTIEFSHRFNILKYNKTLAEKISSSTHILFDLNHLASTIGYWRWSNPNYYYLAKMPFHPSGNEFFVERFASLMAAYCGKSRRGLILDCDNTLWGGVIGDDGIDGIKIGQGTSTGEAHTKIQEMALSLKERGIVLAVSSKNTDSIARKAFQEHPDMVLKEKDIATFQINWSDKAANIQTIAKTLNLGLQSFVFLDDNPAERERVRAALPEVAVPEVGTDAGQYPAFVMNAGYFNAAYFSTEDSKRAEMYAANANREAALSSIGDYDEYLASLEMQISVSPFTEIGTPRIFQLVGKSNQFNLTTIRYSLAEIQSMKEDAQFLDLQVRLIDKFGDNGMISVVTVKKNPQIWDIELWLMSCRVLGRRVEEYLLSYIVSAAKSAGVKKLRGTYIPTDRNGIVEEHYKKLKFELENSEDNKTTWMLDIDTYQQTSALPFVNFDIE